MNTTTHTPENHLQLSIAEILIAVGMTVASFFIANFLAKPDLGWLIILLTLVINKPNSFFKGKILETLKPLLTGASFIVVVTLYLLSTGGNATIFGHASPELFPQIIQNVATFFIASFGTMAVFNGLFHLMQKNGKFNPKKLAPGFFITSMAAFLLLLVNINNLIPWLKSYDYVLLFIFMTAFTISVSLAKKSPEMPATKAPHHEPKA